jgi:hypothetical protein
MVESIEQAVSANRDAAAAQSGLELPPAPEAEVRAVVEKTVEAPIRDDPVDEAPAVSVESSRVEGAARVALRWSALQAMLLPMQQGGPAHLAPGEKRGFDGIACFLSGPGRFFDPVTVEHVAKPRSQ